LLAQNQKFMKLFKKWYPPKKGTFGGGVRLLNVVFHKFHLTCIGIFFQYWDLKSQYPGFFFSTGIWNPSTWDFFPVPGFEIPIPRIFFQYRDLKSLCSGFFFTAEFGHFFVTIVFYKFFSKKIINKKQIPKKWPNSAVKKFWNTGPRDFHVWLPSIRTPVRVFEYRNRQSLGGVVCCKPRIWYCV